MRGHELQKGPIFLSQCGDESAFGIFLHRKVIALGFEVNTELLIRGQHGLGEPSGFKCGFFTLNLVINLILDKLRVHTEAGLCKHADIYVNQGHFVIREVLKHEFEGFVGQCDVLDTVISDNIHQFRRQIPNILR